MEKSPLREGASTSVNVTVGRRSREYLTEREVERLMEAAEQNRSGHRDATAILVAYRHGLRASELVALRWDDIDLATGRLHVRRAKGGDASVHPISARESRALRKLLREAPTSPTSSSRNVAHLFPQPDISAWWPGRACPRNSPFSFIPTCCGTPAGSSSPTTGTTLVPQSLSRPPLDHVHGPLYGFDAQSVQEFLEGLTSSLHISRSVRQVVLPSPRRSVGAGRRDLLSSVRRARPRVKTSQQDGENAG